MHRKKAIVTLAMCLAAGGILRAREFNGPDALAITRKVVAFGPRPSGSEAIKKLQIYILAQLKPFGCQVTTKEH